MNSSLIGPSVIRGCVCGFGKRPGSRDQKLHACRWRLWNLATVATSSYLVNTKDGYWDNQVQGTAPVIAISLLIRGRQCQNPQGLQQAIPGSGPETPGVGVEAPDLGNAWISCAAPNPVGIVRLSPDGSSPARRSGDQIAAVTQPHLDSELLTRGRTALSKCCLALPTCVYYQ